MPQRRAVVAASSIKALEPKNWNRDRLRDLIQKFEGLKIGVVGDIGVDRYTLGTVEKISPEAPVPIVQVREERLKLGLAANVADNVRSLGGECFLSGVVGKDRFAEDLKLLLDQGGIGSSHLVTDPSRRTVLKERIIGERQQLIRVDYETLNPLGKDVESNVVRELESWVEKCSAVILEDYAKGLVTEGVSQNIIGLCKKSGTRILVDPKPPTELKTYLGASVLTPNKKEAEALTGKHIDDEGSLLEVGNRIASDTQADNVVITLGGDGMAVFSDGVCTRIPTCAIEVFDVSGAGDTVVAVLAMALSGGASIEEGAVLGNLAAGVEVSKSGTATVTPKEILEKMESL